MQKVKTLKDYAKEARTRLKTGFWQNYKNNVNKIGYDNYDALATSKVVDYYSKKVKSEVVNKNDAEEVFYQKVKNLLDSYGEAPNIIGLLTDKEYYNSLTYTEKQRYTLNLSQNYLKALERYKKEKELKITF